MMRALTITGNPVQQAYDGGDQLNVRQLANTMNAYGSNFSTIEQAVRELEAENAKMRHKIDACYDFIDWVQKHSPETTAAYKAHNQVLHAFDKAEQGELMYPQAETSA